MRILCIVHVFYPELWPELAGCIRNLDEPFDLVVTCVDGADDIPDMVLRDFPRARILRCGDRGFDVWPFLKALEGTDLSAYDLLVKLHTKRDLPEPLVFNGMVYSGAKWRESLLSFIKTPEAWARSKARILSDERIKMVAAADCILRRRDSPWPQSRAGFDEGLAICRRLGIRPVNPQFVGGTMFAARPAIFKPLVGAFSAADFEGAAAHTTSTTAHYVERAIGFCATADGGRISDPDGRLAAIRLRRGLSAAVRKVGRAVFQIKRKNGRNTVKVFKIPVLSWRQEPSAKEETGR